MSGGRRDEHFMWLFTSIGFYSVVAHRDDPNGMVARARVRDDLERLGDGHLPDMEILEGAGTNYLFRALVPRPAWVDAGRALSEEIDYCDYKNEVAHRQGHERVRAYGRVWDIMWALQEDMR